MYFGLNNGNFATGIKSVIWVADHLGIYQAEFDPVITKLDTQDLTIGVKVSWARHAP